jgi:hypothetical protein
MTRKLPWTTNKKPGKIVTATKPQKRPRLDIASDIDDVEVGASKPHGNEGESLYD